MKYVLTLLLLPLALLGQIVTIQGTDTLKDSRTTINNNFSYLNTQISGKMTNPLTTTGDLIYRDAAGNTVRLPIGSYAGYGQYMCVTSGGIPGWCSSPIPSTSFLLKGNGTGGASAATAADVTSLYTGTPSSTLFLRSDGLLAAPSVGSVSWGSIIGTISSQTDLANALAAKAPLVSNLVPETNLPAMGILPVAADPSGSCTNPTSTWQVMQRSLATGFTFVCASAAGDTAGTWTRLQSDGFDSITNGTAAGKTFTIGDGSTLAASGTGVLNANYLSGVQLSPLSGIVYLAGGVPQVVSGTATDCVTVAGNSSSCGGKPIVGFTDTGTQWQPDGTVFPELTGNNTYTGHAIYPASTTQSLAAVSDTITCNRRTIAISASGALTLTAGPAAGSDGQVCVIANVGSFDVIFPVNGTTNVTAKAKQLTRIQFNLALGVSGEWAQESAGGAALPSTTNLLAGNGSGGASDSGLSAAKVSSSRYCRASGASTTSGTTDNQVATVTLTGIAPYGQIRIAEAWHKTGTAGLYHTKLRVGGTGGSDYLPGSASVLIVNREHSIMLAGPTNEQILSTTMGVTSGSGTIQTFAASADITGGSLQIDFLAWASAADTVTLDAYCIEYIPPAN